MRMNKNEKVEKFSYVIFKKGNYVKKCEENQGEEIYRKTNLW